MTGLTVLRKIGIARIFGGDSRGRNWHARVGDARVTLLNSKKLYDSTVFFAAVKG